MPTETGVVGTSPVLGVCAPVYNEASGIAALVRHWAKVLRSSGESFEIVLCDDGSTDGTLDVLSAIRDLPEMRVVRHASNRGAGAALRTAIAASKAEWLVTIDSDGQFSVEDALRMLDEGRRAGALACLGYRKKQDRALLVWGSAFTGWLASRVYRAHVKDFSCALKVVHGNECRAMQLKATRFDGSIEITSRLLLMGLPVIEVPVSHHPRVEGQSKIRAFRDGWARIQFIRYLRSEARLIRMGSMDLGQGVADLESTRRTAAAEPRAFLFDLDGVLWDSNRLHAEVMARTCEEAGLTMPDYSQLAGRSTPEAFSVVLAKSGNPSGHDTAVLSARKRAQFQERIQEVESEHLALQQAFARKRPAFLAMVTGASRATADAYLSRMPEHFFDLVITADDGFPSKPMPDSYLAAASRLGVEPSECVVFEDSEAGLAAARAAGARVAHITYAWGGECDGRACGADWCAPTVLEALEMVWGEPWQR